MAHFGIVDTRIQHEIEHGRFMAGEGRGEIWEWESPAGRRRWTRRVQMMTADLRPDTEVLEIGCGSGYFTREMVKSRARITAIDISPELLEVARRRVSAASATFMVENAYAMSFAAN